MYSQGEAVHGLLIQLLLHLSDPLVDAGLRRQFVFFHQKLSSLKSQYWNYKRSSYFSPLSLLRHVDVPLEILLPLIERRLPDPVHEVVLIIKL